MANFIHSLKLFINFWRWKDNSKKVDDLRYWKVEYGDKKFILNDEDFKILFEHMQDEEKKENLVDIFFNRKGFDE